MSKHASLKKSGNAKTRSVAKRFERVKILKERGLWKEGESSSIGMPKVKMEK